MQGPVIWTAARISTICLMMQCGDREQPRPGGCGRSHLEPSPPCRPNPPAATRCRSLLCSDLVLAFGRAAVDARAAAAMPRVSCNSGWGSG